MRSFAVLIISISLFACNSTKKTSSAVNESDGTTVLKETASMNQLQASGTNFYGTGNDPVNWTLAMNYDDTVRFNADDGLAVKFAYNSLKKQTAEGKITYTAKINSALINIVQDAKECSVPTAKMAFTHAVSFMYNSRTYSGCGKFLSDNNLNGKWMLEKIGATNIAVDEYNRVPVFQLDLEKKKLSGNDGCNTIGGNIEVQGNRIKFSGIFSTKMACMKKSIDRLVSTLISDKSVNFFFSEGKLVLYLADDSKLTFKRS